MSIGPEHRKSGENSEVYDVSLYADQIIEECREALLILADEEPGSGETEDEAGEATSSDSPS